ncbi:MAG: MMPL family transporter, partial [Thermoplasmataceae archaeon]
NEYIFNYTLLQQPIHPSSYVLYQLEGIGLSTSLIIINFNNQYSNSTKSGITNITNNIKKEIPDSTVYIAGSENPYGQINSEVSSGLVKALAIGISLSVLIVGIYFRSVKAAFMPLLIFIFSALISLGINGLLYKYILHTQISFITPTLLLLLLLGLTSDYVVYIMARYKKELINGVEHPTIISSRWAGHAVFTSGLTVVISYIVLWLSNVPIFSDSGLSNAIGVSTSVILANTLLLSILHRYGRKILNVKEKTDKGHSSKNNIMGKIGVFSTDKKAPLVAVFIIISMISIAFYISTPTNMDINKLLPQSSSIQLDKAVSASFGGDFFDRSFIIVHFNQPLVSSNGTFNIAEMQKLSQIENTTLQTSGIQGIFGPTYPFGTYQNPSLNAFSSTNSASIYKGQMLSFVGNNTKYAEIVFETKSLAWTTPATVSVNNLNNALSHNASSMGYTYNIGGMTESFSNAYSVTSTSFSEMIPILTIAIFIILLIQLSSVLTPIRLIFMVIASVIMSLSIAFFIFHYIQHLPLIIFMPMFTFITLLAVGLDYDIFMITRVREEVMKGKTEKEAIIISVKENGGVIVTLGAVLAVTFGSLYISTLGIIQEIGLSLAIGVIIDTFITWPFFVPAVMLLLKKYNWWPSKIGKNQN